MHSLLEIMGIKCPKLVGIMNIKHDFVLDVPDVEGVVLIDPADVVEYPVIQPVLRGLCSNLRKFLPKYRVSQNYQFTYHYN